MMRFLSDEWLAAADAALADLAPVSTALAVGFKIDAGPAAELSHRLVLGPDRVSVRRGVVGATVTMSLDWELAAAISKGEASAQRAFLDGGIQLAGDPGVLLGHQTQLADIDDRLATLRKTTEYSLP